MKTARLLLEEDGLQLFKVDDPIPEQSSYILSFEGWSVGIPFWRAGEFSCRILNDMIETSDKAKKGFQASGILR
jgi:hypothetical protein